MKPALVILLAATLIRAALAEERLPTIAPEKYTDQQKQAAEDFKAARKVPVFGPFEPMMHSPQLMNHARAMGDYLRFNAAIGSMLSEFAILIAAREWTQDYEWNVHYPLALKAGMVSAAEARSSMSRVTTSFGCCSTQWVISVNPVSSFVAPRRHSAA